MKIELTGVQAVRTSFGDGTSKIPPIKSLRSATGLGLREAKGIVDEFLSGGREPYHFETDSEGRVADLWVTGWEGGVVIPSSITLEQAISFLSHYTRDLQVGVLRDILQDTQRALNKVGAE
jgi:hypothetical protein